MKLIWVWTADGRQKKVHAQFKRYKADTSRESSEREVGEYCAPNSDGSWFTQLMTMP